MSGTLTGYGPKSDAAESKLSGTAKSDGEVSITVTGTGTSVTNVGVWGFNSAGDLVMKVENSRDSSDYTCVTLSTNGQLTPFAGNYTGSLVNEYGYGPYISSFSISAGGSITGTAVPLSDLTTGSYSGSFNSSGVGTVTFTSTVPGLTGYSSNAYAAFTPAGELVAYLTGGYWITLAKSYAGVHKITFRTGATAEFAVSDNGTVSGAWFIGVTPCLLTGTVSSAGALSVTATSVDSNTFATLQITGALWANLGGISGSGTYDGPELTWTSAGQDCSGLIYAGAYTLRSRAYTLAFTVDESGLISGTGDGGAVVTGGVLADGTILIIATPPSLSNAAAATSFSGTLSLKTVTSVKGQGTYMSLDGSSDSWTVTGTRV
jgi:hypothetical protein